MLVKLNIFSFLLGGLGAYLAMKFADRIGLNDIPNNRSSHNRIIPRGGGIGVLIALISASMILSIPVSLWVPSLLIALCSLWGGDKNRLSVNARLVIHFCCSMGFLGFFFYSKQLAVSSYFLCIPMSIFIVGTANFYNFMDGIDGIAGITGVVGFSLLSFYSNLSGSADVYSLLCMVMVFSSLGFLCFNIPTAKVFIGDMGSILLGFVFACLVIIMSKDMSEFVLMAGFIAPFYLDVLFTMIARVKNGDSLIIAHRKHIYQLLVNELGISHWKIALAYGAAQMMIGLSVIFLKPLGISFVLLFYLVCSLIFALVSINIRKKVYAK